MKSVIFPLDYFTTFLLTYPSSFQKAHARGNQSSARTAACMINQKSPSREGELTPMRQGKTLGPLALRVNKENVHGDREISDDAEFSP